MFVMWVTKKCRKSDLALIVVSIEYR
jgi:hypothetical protein